MAFFKDFNPLTYAWNVVHKRARHPNAAKLFTLWTTSSEANRVFENLDYSATGNLLLGTGPMSQQIKRALEAQNIRLVSWWDSKKNLEVLRWFGTPEGAAYSKELAAAQSGRK
jgi:ABC-type Fe3+ transport system substrate-binding protein